jgi:hypothetical protein
MFEYDGVLSIWRNYSLIYWNSREFAFSPQSGIILLPIFAHLNGSEWGVNGRRMVEEW